MAAPLWEPGLVPALSHLELPGQHLTGAGLCFPDKYLGRFVTKVGLLRVASRKGRRLESAQGSGAPAPPPEPASPHQYRTATGTHAAKIGFLGGFPRGSACPWDSLDGLGVLKTPWILAGPLWKGLTSYGIPLSHPTVELELGEGIPVLLLF